jgi:putative FmdB family regulatory protein
VPTYQYACTACDHRFEAVQSFSDPSLTECPHCSGKLRKVFSSVGIVFKGSGFYRTDSRAGATSSAAPAKAEGSSGKSESSSSSDSGSGSGSGSSSSSGSSGSSSSSKDSGSSAPAAAAS